MQYHKKQGERYIMVVVQYCRTNKTVPSSSFLPSLGKREKSMDDTVVAATKYYI